MNNENNLNPLEEEYEQSEDNNNINSPNINNNNDSDLQMEDLNNQNNNNIDDGDDRLTYTIITLGLENLMHLFEENNISFVDLTLLSKEDLKELQL